MTIEIKNKARIAVYDDLLAEPQIIDIEPCEVREFIEKIAQTVYKSAQEQGGSIAYSVIRQVAENFIHADFKEPTVSILNNGNIIRFADLGPGIQDKLRAQLPGFSSATSEMKEYINGVGSGLPIVKEYLSYSHGQLVIEDNLNEGSVITISVNNPNMETKYNLYDETNLYQAPPQAINANLSTQDTNFKNIKNKLTERQIEVLYVLLEDGQLGPSDISQIFEYSKATAYRDLQKLQSFSLIDEKDNKRIINKLGKDFIDYLGRQYG